MFRELQPDIVSICTKPDFHYSVAREAMRQKIPYLICEKPFGTSVAGAEQILALSKKTNATILVHYNRRFDTLHQKIFNNVTNNRYGDFIGGVHYYCNGFINNGCHAINLIQMLFGPIRAVQTVGMDNTDGAVNFDVVVTLASGQRIILKSVLGENYLFESEFMFEKRRIRLERVGGRMVELDYGNTANSRVSDGRAPESLPAVLVHILSLKKGQLPLSNVHDAISTLEVLTAAFLSHERDGQIVRLPLTKQEKRYELKENIVSR